MNVTGGAFLLAPMEAVSDVGFRALCFQSGASFTWTEMIRAKALAKRNKSTLDLVDTFDATTPTGIQMLATGPQELLDAMRVLEELAQSTHPHFANIKSVDLNFGCPSPDVIRIGAGPALLKRRAKLRAIFEALASLRPRYHVSAKIRLGLNQGEMEHKIYLPVVEMANDTLDHITIHARHAKQRSRDAPSWAAIGEAKVHSKIPVVGNGDVFTRADADRMRAETSCDAFLIARAAIRDPWCFRAFTALPGHDVVVKNGTAARDVAEVDAAERAYNDVATGCQTKAKFREFHAANFARIRAALSNSSNSAAHAGSDVVIPANAHMR